MVKLRFCPARRSGVLPSLASQGAIRRGLEWLGIVRSCPVRLVEAMFAEVFRGMVSHGGAGSCPAGSSGAWFCRLWRFLVRSGCAGRAAAEWGFAWHGKVRRFMERLCGAGLGFVLHGKAISWQGGVEKSEVRHSAVWHSAVLSWLGEVLFCIVGWIGALYSKVRSYCGMAWNREALHSMVKFCPVMYSVAVHAKALLRCGIVRYGRAESGFARLCVVGQALLRHYHGLAWPGEVGRCMVKRASAFFGRVRLGFVMWGPVLHGFVMHSMPWLGIHGYGGYRT